jgi:hypothetical protein
VTLKGKSLAGTVNDDWRVNGRITAQLGLRYELLWPFIEASGQLVNLDVTPNFTPRPRWRPTASVRIPASSPRR